MQPRVLEGFGWNEPSPINHTDFHNRSVALAVKMFNDKEAAEVLTGLFVLVGSEHAAVIHAPWDGPREKDAFAHAMRQTLQHPIFDAYAFITEAWMAKMTKDEDVLKIPPSQHPDREDTLNIWTTLRDGTTKMTRFGVKIYPNVLPFLPPTKKPRLLERDDHFLEGLDETMTGRMFNFFETTAESRKREKAAYRRHHKKERKSDG
jgi:hypothetical protein